MMKKFAFGFLALFVAVALSEYLLVRFLSYPLVRLADSVVEFLLFFGGVCLVWKIKFYNKQINIWKIVVGAIVSVIVFEIFKSFAINMSYYFRLKTSFAYYAFYSIAYYAFHSIFTLVKFLGLIFSFIMLNKFIFKLKNCLIQLKKYVLITIILIFIFTLLNDPSSRISLFLLFRCIMNNNIINPIERFFYVNIYSFTLLLQSIIMGTVAIGISKKYELE